MRAGKRRSKGNEGGRISSRSGLLGPGFDFFLYASLILLRPGRNGGRNGQVQREREKKTYQEGEGKEKERRGHGARDRALASLPGEWAIFTCDLHTSWSLLLPSPTTRQGWWRIRNPSVRICPLYLLSLPLALLRAAKRLSASVSLSLYLFAMRRVARECQYLYSFRTLRSSVRLTMREPNERDMLIETNARELQTYNNIIARGGQIICPT